MHQQIPSLEAADSLHSRLSTFCEFCALAGGSVHEPLVQQQLVPGLPPQPLPHILCQGDECQPEH